MPKLWTAINKWNRCNVGQASELILENRRTIICKLANMLGILVWSVQCILKDKLNMHLIYARFVAYNHSLCFVCEWCSGKWQNNCPSASSLLNRFINVTSFLSKISRWHESEGNLMVFPWFKQNCGSYKPCSKQSTLWKFQAIARPLGSLCKAPSKAMESTVTEK